MTLQNSERLLAHYKSLLDNQEVSQQVRLNAQQAHENMLANIARRGVKPASSAPAKTPSSKK